MKNKKINITINGQKHESTVSTNLLLLDFIRENINMTGTKWGCLTGDCGACTILLNGIPVNSCIILAVDADDSEILTVEGLAKDGQLSQIQKSFIEKGAAQCGYCTPGFLISSKYLLDKTPNRTEDEIRYQLAGNLCRCTGYNKIVDAVIDASKKRSS